MEARRGSDRAIRLPDAIFPLVFLVLWRVKGREDPGTDVVKKKLLDLDLFFPGPESMEVAVLDSMNDPSFGQFHLQDNFRLGCNGS